MSDDLTYDFEGRPSELPSIPPDAPGPAPAEVTVIAGKLLWEGVEYSSFTLADGDIRGSPVALEDAEMRVILDLTMQTITFAAQITDRILWQVGILSGAGLHGFVASGGGDLPIPPPPGSGPDEEG